MPASGIDLQNILDAKNAFNVLRQTLNYPENFKSQCRSQQFISTNCYYGYHDPSRRLESPRDDLDCEMHELPPKADNLNNNKSSLNLIESNPRKRSANDSFSSRSKRLRQEVQTKKNNEPETNENMKLDRSTEDLLATLYWHTHGGNLYQCV
ncbi:uncharacterized protein LOC126970680 [Leptidea sinapis]|uniref:uncharacterized protein LOC126970680 n=1 Tax=Leptidea sinapis TaxID=189913 RepID=UPI0021C38928|nr:uncharacterized protein LOC126970680 [Leptidea sinapis]